MIGCVRACVSVCVNLRIKCNSLPAGKLFMHFCRLLLCVCFFLLSKFFFFFSISTFLKNSFSTTIRVSNSLDSDQARRLLGLICVQTVCGKDYQQTTPTVNIALPYVGKERSNNASLVRH